MKRGHISDALDIPNGGVIEDTGKVRANAKLMRKWIKWSVVAALVLMTGGIFIYHQAHNSTEVVSLYDCNSVGCYAVPGNGQIVYETAVREARERYSGKDVTFLLAFDLFENEKPVSGEKDEYQRLISDGYELYLAEYWTYQGQGEKKYDTKVVGRFTEEALAFFKNDPRYGYFFYFAKNGDGSPIRVDQDDLITGYTTDHS